MAETLTDETPLDAEEKRLLPYKDIADQVVAQERRMDAVRARMAMADAMYGNRFWEWVHDEKRDSVSEKFKLFDNKYEMNFLKPACHVFLGKMFTHRIRAKVGRTATTTGNPDLAGLVLNRVFFSPEQRKRLDQGWRMAWMHPGCGFKIIWEDGDGPAYQRVFLRVFPWWEILTDHDVHDEAEARFIGHLHYRPKHEVAEEYDIPLEELKGSPRADFLSQTDTRANQNQRSTKGSTGDERASSDRDKFVRVLELCNLVDPWCDPDTGEESPGRLEIYVLGQGALSKKPIYEGRLPIDDYNGSPLAHIVAHVFDHETAYPLRGVAPSSMHTGLNAEHNAYRSQMAEKASADKVFYLVAEALGVDLSELMASARSNEVVKVPHAAAEKVGYANLAHLLQAVQPARGLEDVKQQAEMVRSDIMSFIAPTPSAVGVTQKVTAKEIEVQEDFTDSEYGRYGEARERTLATLATLYLRALVAAMECGSFISPDTEELDDPSVIEAEYEDADDRQDEGRDAIEDDTDEDSEYGASPLPGEQDDDEEEPEDEELTEAASGGDVYVEAEVPEKAPDPNAGQFAVMWGKQVVQITVADLDSEFDIGFTEAGRTPADEADTRASLQKVLSDYMKLWEIVSNPKAGPMRIIARAAMQAMYEAFRLPPDLDPEELERAVQDAEEQAQADKQDAAPDIAEASGAQPTPDQILDEIEAEYGQVPEIMQAVQRVRAMPDDQKADGVQVILQAIDQAGAAGAEAPPAEQVPPGAPPAPPAAPAPGGM